jgi:ribosomal protein S21
MINIEVERGANENSVSLLRRFTKRVQGAGVLPRVRSIRYASRNISEAVKRKKDP